MRIISVIGYKKSGKTTLVELLVKALKEYGSVGTVKHMQEHSVNTPDTDTWKHARAGADVVIGVTGSELVKFSHDNNLVSAMDELANEGVDFGVVEGFKESTLSKIALGSVVATNIVKTLDNLENVDIGEIVKIVLDQPEYHTLESLIKKIRGSKEIEKAGAIGTFTGIVRTQTKDVRTEFLEFEEYGGLARQKMDQICTELKHKEGVVDVLMHHRTGIIKAGEDIVYVVVAAEHREQLFPVLREAVERLKAEVPIWKKEHTLTGEWWVHDDSGQG
ncbi:MAG: molybdopterin synthase [Candidatus Methanoperedens sp.]|nr:molybdopterin synthase [Candidatus Methanoperedens sp.]MCZ7369151.1 molybdopterin synthase [Candidatus Methanoperedens sp.]